MRLRPRAACRASSARNCLFSPAAICKSSVAVRASAPWATARSRASSNRSTLSVRNWSIVPSSCSARSRQSCSPCALATTSARANACSASPKSYCRATRPITSRASHATSGRSLSAACNAARASSSASASRPWPMATCAAHASACAGSTPGEPRATSMLAVASAQRAPVIAARAISRCRFAARADSACQPSRASSRWPISMARSTWPDIAKTSVSASSTAVPRVAFCGPIS